MSLYTSLTACSTVANSSDSVLLLAELELELELELLLLLLLLLLQQDALLELPFELLLSDISSNSMDAYSDISIT